MAEESLLCIPVGRLAVKCTGCGTPVAAQERKLRCKCGGVCVEAEGEVIKIRHRVDTEHGPRPFEVVKA